LANIVDLAIAENAKLLVIAGDLYDGPWRDMRTGLWVVSQFARATRAGIRVAIVYGNHDAESRLTKGLPMPDGVQIFGTRRCETWVLDDLGVAIHGRSFRDAAVTENLAATYCPPTKGVFNLAVLHTALEGGHAHAPYAPCTVGELASSGHDYWALGHVHDHKVHAEFPHIVYPGNSQGRHVRETGAKGVVIGRVEAGKLSHLEFRPVDEVRWATGLIDTAECADKGEFFEAVQEQFSRTLRAADSRPVAMRLTLDVGGKLGQQLLGDRDWLDSEIRAVAAATSDELWVEKVKFSFATEVTFQLPAIVEELLAGAADDEDCQRAVADALEPLLTKIPSPLVTEDNAPVLTAAKARSLAAVIEEARQALAAKLTSSSS
jgi:hypothetical protein